ncbi:MAG: hypothetical protein Q4G09_01175 [Clostridia bacterium]|nr:hypothetical protein [Clostridia bacterium]
MENASKALIIAGAILIAILLISIGVVLINSGRDVTGAGSAAMQSQNIQIFNNQFTPYEGSKKGSELKALFSTVQASNASYPDHQVEFKDDGGVTSVVDLVMTKTYTVTLDYGEGYVMGITVK